ncbi:MAG: TIGR01459 family HAD-type hydrolase [Rhodobacterales bacterium]|nr:MAG: TIGR01459 family HAD-type hydrolase [Rhodobacterales bacterium]
MARFPRQSRAVNNLADLADNFDTFLLDAFGVLNVGDTPIAGAPERIAALQAAGKRVMVLSNAASYPKRVGLEKLRRLGYALAPEDLLSSREVLLSALTARPGECPRERLGLIAPDTWGLEELEGRGLAFVGDDRGVYDAVDGFVMLSAAGWSENRQALLEASLTARARPVWVGNPDLVAPQERGLSLEPGHFAHRLADAAGVAPVFFGKPFANAFEAALARLPQPVDRSRVVMVGDTLHTDILGGAAAGLATALITGHGALRGLDVAKAIAQSGIRPDFILPDP